MNNLFKSILCRKFIIVASIGLSSLALADDTKDKSPFRGLIQKSAVRGYAPMIILNVNVLRAPEDDYAKIKELIKDKAQGIYDCVRKRKGRLKLVWQIAKDDALHDLQVTNLTELFNKETLACVKDKLALNKFRASNPKGEVIICDISWEVY